MVSDWVDEVKTLSVEQCKLSVSVSDEWVRSVCQGGVCTQSWTELQTERRVLAPEKLCCVMQIQSAFSAQPASGVFRGL